MDMLFNDQMEIDSIVNPKDLIGVNMTPYQAMTGATGQNN